jgi:hypothetical protein
LWGCGRRRRREERGEERERMTESESESERLAGTLGKVKVSEGKAGHQRAGRQAGKSKGREWPDRFARERQRQSRAEDR